MTGLNTVENGLANRSGMTRFFTSFRMTNPQPQGGALPRHPDEIAAASHPDKIGKANLTGQAGQASPGAKPPHLFFQ